MPLIFLPKRQLLRFPEEDREPQKPAATENSVTSELGNPKDTRLIEFGKCGLQHQPIHRIGNSMQPNDFSFESIRSPEQQTYFI